MTKKVVSIAIIIAIAFIERHWPERADSKMALLSDELATSMRRFVSKSNNGNGIQLRPVAARDHREMCRLLSQLTSICDVHGKAPSRESFEAWVQSLPKREHVALVAEDTLCGDGALLGTASVLIERKLVHGCGAVAHIEDVVVDKRARGRGVALLLVDALGDIGRERGCYKAILDCSISSAGFYERCGYHRAEIQMRKDIHLQE